ncbi:TetR family transcriptional regulator C-terminal domain-containing protein [Rhodobacteraceae bacterium KMM 6894]|nr:TetR family transcriptional regulator C-terminal domain-containing protein [Rhodobacteraceae bacterium KMM 6894]
MTDVTPRAAKTNKTVGRTASKEVRRQQLIEATIESIAKYGISGTTTTTVTGFAGLSLGLVNFHFKNKDTLMEETLRFLAQEHSAHWQKRVQAAVNDPATQLQAQVDSHFHPDICTRKKLAVWFNFYGEAQYRAAYRRIVVEMDNERWDVSVGLCQQLIQQGGYAGVNARDIADTLEGLYDGFWLNIMIYPGSFTRKMAHTRLNQYLATVFPRHFDSQAGLINGDFSETADACAASHFKG